MKKRKRENEKEKTKTSDIDNDIEVGDIDLAEQVKDQNKCNNCQK